MLSSARRSSAARARAAGSAASNARTDRYDRDAFHRPLYDSGKDRFVAETMSAALARVSNASDGPYCAIRGADRACRCRGGGGEGGSGTAASQAMRGEGRCWRPWRWRAPPGEHGRGLRYRRWPAWRANLPPVRIRGHRAHVIARQDDRVGKRLGERSGPAQMRVLDGDMRRQMGKQIQVGGATAVGTFGRHKGLPENNGLSESPLCAAHLWSFT